MDSITQAALGAALGEAALGRRVGRKAALWGAALGTLPDLDILAYPLLDPVQELAFHRGPTHALLFSVVVAPLVGLGLARLHRRDGVPWRGWTLLAFLALFTHPLLDALTVYGTQLFWPFSDLPAAYPVLFIIDPLYTLPLLAGVVAAVLMPRTSRWRTRVNAAGLVVSTAYVLAAVGGKQVADRDFRRALAREGVAYEDAFTAPTPFNTLLWMGMARTDEHVWVGLTSLLDDDRPMTLRRIDRHAGRLVGHEDDRAVARLRWFSRGYFTTDERDGRLFLHDLRFGRSDTWLTDDGAYIFSWRLVPATQSAMRYVSFEQAPIDTDRFEGAQVRRLLERIAGE